MLSESKMERIRPYFPLAHDIPRIGDRRVLSGYFYVVRNGPQWKDAPREYSPHKTLYIAGAISVSLKDIFTALVEQAEPSTQLMIDAPAPNGNTSTLPTE
ncbi:transposase [Aristophania vespae]|uniref:transposase n=1 Tax=Aristophania vespae TaxID=2697033 RepID=UPI0038D0936C